MKRARYTKQFTLSLNSEVYQRVKAQSDRDNRSTAEVLRDIIDLGLESLEKEENNNE